jgi:hypothetical protein
VSNTVTPAEQITPEMIDAGELEFARYDSRFDSDEEAEVRIYWAMISAKGEHHPGINSNPDTIPVDPI